MLVWVALAHSLYKTEALFSVEYRCPWDASWSVLMHYAHGLQTPTMTSTGREIAFFGLGVFLLLAGWLRSAIIDGLLDRAAKGLGNICGHAEVWVTAVLAVGMNFASEFVPQPNRLSPGKVIVALHRPAVSQHPVGPLIPPEPRPARPES